jgi:hypothetical protein
VFKYNKSELDGCRHYDNPTKLTMIPQVLLYTMVLCIPGHSAIVPLYFSPAGTVPKFVFFFRHPRKCVINLWHQVLEIHHAVADISIAHIMPKGPRKRSHILRGVESNDPNDAAIELVTRWVLLGPKLESRARAMVHFLLCEGSNRFLQ